MRKERSLFLIGLWVIVLPFLGFPNSWKITLSFLTGILIIYIAYLFYLETKERLSKINNEEKSFVDNMNHQV